MFTRLFIQYLLMTVRAKRCSGFQGYLSEPHRWGPDFIESLGPSTEVGLGPPLATLELVFPRCVLPAGTTWFHFPIFFYFDFWCFPPMLISFWQYMIWKEITWKNRLNA